MRAKTINEKYTHPNYPALEDARFKYANTLWELDKCLIELEKSLPAQYRDPDLDAIVNNIRKAQKQLLKESNKLTIKLRLS